VYANLTSEGSYALFCCDDGDDSDDDVDDDEAGSTLSYTASIDLPYEVDISTSGSGRLANKLHWRVWYNTTGKRIGDVSW